MTTPRDQANEFDEWLDYAKSDLAGAHKLLESDEIDPRLACWHIQQAVEKAIKAALISEGIRPEYTHDLEELLDALPSRWNGCLNGTIDLERVSSWATETRYPSAMPQVSRTDAQATLDQARTLIQEIENGICMRLDNSGPSMT